MRVLVVDDEKLVREVLCEFLRLKGYIVSDAETGSSALGHFSIFLPDLVLLDILMPGMNGIEVLSLMKALNPNVCVIMLTAVADMTIAQDAIEHGAYNYLTKPIDFDKLAMCLEAHGLLRSKA